MPKRTASKRSLSTTSTAKGKTDDVPTKKPAIEEVIIPSSTFSTDEVTLNRKASGQGLRGKGVMLAHKHDDSVNPKNWWMSEKLDGVRAFWDGKNFYSRLGNKFSAPKWYTQSFPSDYELDGEFFTGRGDFRTTVSIVKTKLKIDDEKWKTVKFHIFDAPNIKGTFEDRINIIGEYFVQNSNANAYVLTHTKCCGLQHMEEELKKVEALGGEGLMIRKPGSLYEECRSTNLLKIKTFHDAEAVVIGYKKGQGRNSHRTGALHVQMECGKTFYVGSGLVDKDRDKPPKKGSIITYRFQELTGKSGLPRFPTFVGVRIDMTEAKDAVLPVVNKS